MYKVTRYSASVDHIYMQTVSRITRKMDNSSLQNGCKDLWMWSSDAKTANVTLDDKDPNKAIFNAPQKLDSSKVNVHERAVVLGTVPMNTGSHYWEVKLHKEEQHQDTFIALGVATDKAIIHNFPCSAHDYIQDTNIWVMSSNSALFHKGMARVDYTKPFYLEKETVIGLFLNKDQGTLSYYKDGHPLGIAFEGLDGIKDDLFPYATCMTGKMEMTLGKKTRIFTVCKNGAMPPLQRKFLEDQPLFVYRSHQGSCKISMMSVLHNVITTKNMNAQSIATNCES